MSKVIYAGFPKREEACVAGMSANWKIYPATDEGIRQAVKDGYKAITVYEFSKPVENKETRPLIFGDLYLDFDAKKEIIDEQGKKQEMGDIDKSLRAIRIFVNILVEDFNVNPDALKFWASGNKGFHMCIPRQLIGSEEGDNCLPEIYRDMINAVLLDMYNPKLWDGIVIDSLRDRACWKLEDFCIDSNMFKKSGKQLIRLPHQKRLDGNYKVPITYSEIMEKDAVFFMNIVKSDRTIPHENEKILIQRNTNLEALFIKRKGVVTISSRYRNSAGYTAAMENECAFLEYCREHPTEVTEPQWFMLARILVNCGALGSKLFHEYSRRDPVRYKTQETEKKLINATMYPIPTCEEIQHLFKCGHTCKVKCPIDLFNKGRAESKSMEHYQMTNEGLFYYPSLKDMTKCQKVCSNFEVVALGRDSENLSWAKIVEFRDLDNTIHTVIIPWVALLGKSEDALAALVNGGLRIEPGKKAKAQLLEYLTYKYPTCRGRILDANGWTDSTIRKYIPFDLGKQEDGQEYLTRRDGAIHSTYEQRGTLQEWKENIGLLCRGNPLLMITVIMGLAGPMLQPMKHQGFGLHLYGKSSSGKTTAIEVGSSVNGAETQTWRATDNGLEGIAEAHNDNTLWLDEIGQAEPDVVGNTAYMLATGRGKARSTKSGKTRRICELNILFSSTGEVTVAERANLSFKNKAMTGHEVRVINLLANGGTENGIFTIIPDNFTANTFANHLKEICNKYRGTALFEFVQFIKSDPDSAVEIAKKFQDKFLSNYDIEKMNGQTLRVLRNLAFLAGVGELAIAAEILPWEGGEASSCVEYCFSKWIDNASWLTSGEIKTAIEKLIFQVQNKFFGKVDDETGMIQKTTEHSKLCYHISRQFVVHNICQGYYYNELVDELSRMGVLAVDKNGKPKEQSWINSKHSPRGICIIVDDLLNGEDMAQTDSEEFKSAGIDFVNSVFG